MSDLPPCRCLIVFPGFGISTSTAFEELGARLTKSPRRSKMMTFGTRPLFPVMEWGPAENDFEPLVFAKWPELARLKRRFIQAGAETALLTGSGSALYAVFDSAEQLARARQYVPAGWKVFSSRTLTRAEYWRRSVEEEP